MSDRTEPATPKRRQELRERGDVARSRDLASVVAFIGIVLWLGGMGADGMGALVETVRQALATTHERTLDRHMLVSQGAQAGLVLLRVVGPVVAVALLLGVAANVAQTGWLFAPKALTPQLNRLNPVQNLKRLVSMMALIETLKAFLKISIVSYVAAVQIRDALPRLLQAARMDIVPALGLVGDLLYGLAIRIGLLLLVLSAIDFLVQRWQFEKQSRMSKQDVKDEAKQQDSSPMVKSRIRARQRQFARHRMMEEVPTADVVITNPNHFAVALRYDPAQMGAPVLVAKGVDVVAERIRAIAREHDVPIVENPPLARGLFRRVEIGREVPGDFYAAVAEVLAYVYQINRRRKAYARP